jgi:hypothetical protein
MTTDATTTGALMFDKFWLSTHAQRWLFTSQELAPLPASAAAAFDDATDRLIQLAERCEYDADVVTTACTLLHRLYRCKPRLCTSASSAQPPSFEECPLSLSVPTLLFIAAKTSSALARGGAAATAAQIVAAASAVGRPCTVDDIGQFKQLVAYFVVQPRDFCHQPTILVNCFRSLPIFLLRNM